MQLSLLQHVLWSQLDAALLTADSCMRACSDEIWNRKVGNLLFCQAAFHTFIFADLYLSPSEDRDAFKRQPFHVANQSIFKDYEEFADRVQVCTYEKPFILEYATHCRKKARDVIFAETESSLAGDSGFSWRKSTRIELHIYNARHIQHHAAQLSLRLRLDAGIDIAWVGRGKEL